MDPEEVQPTNPTLAPPNGRYNGRLDDRGRLKLPSVFQTFLSSLPEKGLFVTSIDRHTAQIYPNATWRENLALLKGQLGPNKRHAQTILFNAQDFGADAEMDSQGRVTLNTYLRQKLEMDAQGLHLYWEDGHINLFTEAAYQKMLSDAEQNTAEALDAIQGVGLQ